MFFIFASSTSIMTVIGRIRIIARTWVGRVIFPMLATLFLLFTFIFLLGAESDDDDKYDESDDDGSDSEFTFGLCFLQFNVELCSHRVIFT